tara:strand:+ start:2192 stop:2536 length:345 start_codon:yes stop_codon:yes gene_type:complete
MIKNIDIKEDSNQIIVSVEVEERNDRLGMPKARLTTSEVTARLEEKGIAFGQCIQEATIKNWHPRLLEGTWIFEKKTLDKTPKPVIIEEEKEVQSKPPRKRRARSSSKKVSTED